MITKIIVKTFEFIEFFESLNYQTATIIIDGIMPKS